MYSSWFVFKTTNVRPCDKWSTCEYSATVVTRLTAVHNILGFNPTAKKAVCVFETKPLITAYNINKIWQWWLNYWRCSIFRKLLNSQFLELSRPNRTKFANDYYRRFTRMFSISYILPQFKTKAIQRRLWSKIKGKFRTLPPCKMFEWIFMPDVGYNLWSMLLTGRCSAIWRFEVW